MEDNLVGVFVHYVQRALRARGENDTREEVARRLGITPQQLSSALQRGAVTTRTLRKWQKSLEAAGLGMIAVTIAGDSVTGCFGGGAS